MKKISDIELRQWIDESGHHHDHHHHHHDDDFHDYTKAVNEYRKTFPDKQQVIEQTPDPAVREMLLHMQELGIETTFDRFDRQQPQCTFGLAGNDPAATATWGLAASQKNVRRESAVLMPM